MKTDLKLFRKNFKELKREGSTFVRRGRQIYLNYLKIYVCTESFIQDRIRVEKVASMVSQTLIVTLMIKNMK